MILDLMLGNFDNPLSPPPTTELIDEVFDVLGGSFIANDRDFITTYKVGDILGNAKTEVKNNSNGNGYEATITINKDLVNNSTKLALVKTILHESIHAYLSYTAKQYPLVFTNPSGDFTSLITAWQVHNSMNYAHHLYMADLAQDMAVNIGNFVSQEYGYPNPSASGSTLAYYEAVAWSGIAQIDDPTNEDPTIQIDNPLFIELYPNINDREHIKKIYQTENANNTFSGYNPLKDDNCN